MVISQFYRSIVSSRVNHQEGKREGERNGVLLNRMRVGALAHGTGFVAPGHEQRATTVSLTLMGWKNGEIVEQICFHCGVGDDLMLKCSKWHCTRKTRGGKKQVLCLSERMALSLTGHKLVLILLSQCQCQEANLGTWPVDQLTSRWQLFPLCEVCESWLRDVRLGLETFQRFLHSGDCWVKCPGDQ